MRSLFVDDIPGAKPKRHYFDKAIYRQRHQQEIIRHSKKNPQQKRVIEWYQPSKKATQPMDRNDDQYWRTKKTLRKSFGLDPSDLSKSMPMTEIRSKSVIFKNEPDMSRSSILSGTGKNSLMMNSSVHEDPYFPHRYVDKAVGESNKWSGSRVWQEEPTKIVNLPSVKESYFKRW